MIALLLLALISLTTVLWWLSRPLRVATANAAATEGRAELQELHDRLIAQLNELDAERADHGMDSAVARDEELRLSAELAAVLRQMDALKPEVQAVAAASGRGNRAVLASLALLLVLVGGGMYAWMNSANLQGFVLAARTGAVGTRVPPMVFEMISKLEQRLAENPDDAEGWARLGRSYVVLESRDKALAAYARAYQLAPDNTAVLSDYAWLVFNQDPGVTTGLVQTLYSRLGKLEPTHPDALWFLGFSAYQQGEYRKALTHWERLLKIIPAEDPGRQHLQQAMDSAREKMQSGRQLPSGVR